MAVRAPLLLLRSLMALLHLLDRVLCREDYLRKANRSRSSGVTRRLQVPCVLDTAPFFIYILTRRTFHLVSAVERYKFVDERDWDGHVGGANDLEYEWTSFKGMVI
jgi:hypothetical protein